MYVSLYPCIPVFSCIPVSLLSDFPKDLIYVPCGISQDGIVRLPSLNALHNKRMIIRFRTFISLSLQSK